MTRAQLKVGYLALASLTTIATTWFLYYLFFLLEHRFGFHDRENLWLTALYGFIYIFSAWLCGKFAHRYGPFLSLKLGLGGLTLVMVAGGLLPSVAGVITVLVFYSIVLLFIWPALESLVSANETRAGVQHYVGVYNYTWAGSAALAYFTGGKLFDRFGVGAVFWIPAAVFFLQFLSVFWLEHEAAKLPPANVKREPEPHHPEAAAARQPVKPETFLKMAWLANPFAYVGINTVLAVMPGIAAKLGLSATGAGFFGCVWFFARLVTFVWLWRWNGWHYRFRWLLSAFLMLIGSFLLLLLAHQLWLGVLAQIIFGVATGLIYYSSLFYSMDVGEASAEHGGLHEAAIGAGIFAGPAIGAAVLQFAPQHPVSGVLAVTGLLFVGFLGLIWLRIRNRPPKVSAR